MNPPHCHEVTLLRRQLDAAERELAHRANAASIAADRYTRMRAIAIRRKTRIDQLWGARLPLPPCNPRSTCFPSHEDAEPSGSGPFGF